jgi:hypothetical protein
MLELLIIFFIMVGVFYLILRAIFDALIPPRW